MSLDEEIIGEYVYYGYIDGEWEPLELQYSYSEASSNDGRIYALGTVSFEPDWDEPPYIYYSGTFELEELYISAPIPEPGETVPLEWTT